MPTRPASSTRPPGSISATPQAASTKAVGFCPAVLDYEARIFEVPCPFDLHLRLARDAEGNLQLQ